MIVTGDPTQIDLPPGQKSGLVEARAHPRRRRGHRPRHLQGGRRGAPRLVRRIVTAYDARRSREATAPTSQPRSAIGTAGRDRRSTSSIEAGRLADGLGRGGAWRSRRPSAALAVALEAGRRTSSSASCSPTMPRSGSSTATGAARTSRPTCCPSRLAGQPGRCSGRRHLGDIVLAAETVAREAEDEGKDARGPFHPSRRPRPAASARLRPRDRGGGGDHGSARGQALATLGIADPYRDRQPERR